MSMTTTSTSMGASPFDDERPAPRPPGADDPTGEGLASRRQLDALLEVIAGYLLLVAANWAWYREDMGWLGASLHPYFALVLLIAARYGTIDGLVAGTAGAMLHVGFRLATQPGALSGPGALVDLELMRVPYLLVLLGTIVGEVRQVAEDENRALARVIRDLKAELDKLGSEQGEVRKYNDDLKGRIAASTNTTGAFYESAAGLQTLSEDEALPAVLDMVQRSLGAEKCAIYVRTAEGWDLRVQQGWESPDEFERTLPSSHPVMQRVDDGKVVSLRDAPELGQSNIVLAAPLTLESAQGTARTYGAVVVQKIPLSALHSSTLRSLHGLGRWASRVLASAVQYERVAERDPTDEATGTFRYPYLLRRLEEECGRWRRYHTTTSVLLLRIVNFERIPRRKRPAFLTRVARMLMRGIRQVDIAARWKGTDTFALLLPSTGADGSRILASRMVEQFNREVLQDVPRSAELALIVGIGVTGVHGDTRDDLVRAAERMEIGR